MQVGASLAPTLGILLALSCGITCTAEKTEPVTYGIASWELDRRGSHRAVVKVEQRAKAVLAHLPWRRRDRAPESNAVIVVDASTGNRLDNVVPLEIKAEFGHIVFEPHTVPGEYYIYYLPHRKPSGPMDGRSYRYLSPEDNTDLAWRNRNHLVEDDCAVKTVATLPRAKLLRFEARSEFDRFDPMEVKATADETRVFLATQQNHDYFVFPEDRRFPIKMFEAIPLHWIEQGPRDQFSGQVQPGEYFTFQLGVWAARQSIDDLELELSDLVCTSPIRNHKSRIKKSHATCFNVEGTDWLGRPLKKVFEVPKGQVRALWVGVPIPKDASGTYGGFVTLRPQSGPETKVEIRLHVAGPILSDHGDSELWRHSRLRWLNSALGLEDTLVAPFTPLQVAGNKVTCLGREVTFGDGGLPRSIRSFFRHGELADERHSAREILAGPIRFVVQTKDGPVDWRDAPTRVISANDAVVIRESVATSGPLTRTARVKMEFDGCLQYEVVLAAADSMVAEDIRLEIPVRREVAKYMMGFSLSGGHRPSNWDWEWKENFSDNLVWLGDPSAGLQCKLVTAPYVWQWGDLKATGLPDSWWNRGKGGARMREINDHVLLTAYSGPRQLEPDAPLVYRFRFLVTPFKPIDKRHWNWRIGAAHRGATIKHEHHSTEVNPFINYPFARAEALADDVRAEKAKGHQKYMLYYTVRELSNFATELWALRSLGDEIFLTGDDRGSTPLYEVMGNYQKQGAAGGGYPWLQEHLVGGYSWRWMTPTQAPGEPVDASIATTPLSRWHNYYIEGLNWLIKHTDIDGLYLDGIGYDREIMKRVARVLHGLKSESGYINFHTGNAAHDATTYRITPMSGYMEHLPYVSHLHFGEQFDNRAAADYYLIEMSGIPFGLVNEYRGTPHRENPYRGMIYAGAGRFDPSRYSLWRFWDDFGIQETEMIGYWEPDCPVRTGREDILATVYRKNGKALIALASWAPNNANVKLNIDWEVLGLDTQSATLTAPAIKHFQMPAKFSSHDKIPVPAGKGWLLVVE